MEKLKIISISSEDYPGGRFDSFIVPLLDSSRQEIHHKYIIPLFRELGFTEDYVNDLDIDFENQSAGNYFFVYGNTHIKAILVIEEKTISINFDTSLPRKKINKVVEKYFKFPKQ